MNDQTIKLKYYPSPKSLIRRFIAKRTRLSAIAFGLIVSIYMYSKASSFVKAYPTALSRQKLVESLGNNVGIKALLGQAHHIETFGGYAAWNFLLLIATGGAVYGLLQATKFFRGEEDNGQMELLLTGQTTARKAALNCLLGLAEGILIIFLILVVMNRVLSHLGGNNFGFSSGVFFALSLLSGLFEFVAIGMLMSQLMPVRSRATGAAAIILGSFYMLRLAADTTSASWLLNLSPIGWIEKLQPLYGSQPIWLLPIGLFSLVVATLAVYLAGKRDLGSALVADKATAKAKLKLLNSPIGSAWRLSRGVDISWLLDITMISFLYGLLAKSAIQAFDSSAKTKHILAKVTHAHSVSAVTAFMGITFFLAMTTLMFYAAHAINKVRQDEAEGYLDNFLVRPVSRWRLLSGRIAITGLMIISLALISGLAGWVGQASQHAGVPFHLLLLAGINVAFPVILILGIGVLAYGILPRLTAVVVYSAIGWSFLVTMLASGLNINHWLLDTSILHQVAFAPAVNPHWTANFSMLGLACIFLLIGAIAFNRRDLQVR